VPKSITHAVVVTDDFEGSIRFLNEICGLAPVGRYSPAPGDLSATLGWPAFDDDTEAAIVGEGPGSLDLVAIPPSLRSTVKPGVALLAVPTADVAARAAQVREAGFDAAEPRTAEGAGGMRITMAPVRVGGVGYELIRFG
jgi:catechol 2,3-dioxygenase-like lactoylglutathione lyase family enzyme